MKYHEQIELLPFDLLEKFITSKNAFASLASLSALRMRIEFCNLVSWNKMNNKLSEQRTLKWRRIFNANNFIAPVLPCLSNELLKAPAEWIMCS